MLLTLYTEIRDHIIAGRIDDAKDLLYDEFPSLMNPDDMTPSSFQEHHLELDLDIQSLIEASRTSSAPIDPSYDEIDPSDDEVAISLLLRAQHLYALAGSLVDDGQRKRYLRQLGDVCGIFAYPYPEQSPLGGYYDQKRRDALASQVKGAVLRKFHPIPI